MPRRLLVLVALWSTSTAFAVEPTPSARPSVSTQPLPAKPILKALVTAPGSAAIKISDVPAAKFSDFEATHTVHIDGMFPGAVPESLKGATAVFRTVIPKSSAHTYRTDSFSVEVLADTFLLFAVEPEHLYPRVIFPGLTFWNADNFLENGWTWLDVIALSPHQASTTPSYLLYGRRCKAGESLTIPTRSRIPPLLIVPNAAVESRLVEWEPDSNLPEKQQRDWIAFKIKHLLKTGRFEDLDRWLSIYLNKNLLLPGGRHKIASANQSLAPVYQNVGSQKRAEQHVVAAQEWLKMRPDSRAARLVTASLLIEFAAMMQYSRDPSLAELIDASRRRALELLNDVERDDPTIAETYRLQLALAEGAEWSPDLVDDFVDRVLKHCDWAPEALAGAYELYTRQQSGESEEARNERIAKFLDRLHERTKDRFGDAYRAVLLSSWRYTPVDWPFRVMKLEWSQLKNAFEDLIRRHPGPSRSLQWYCLFACVNGDRETAARLFQQIAPGDEDLGSPPQIEGVWRNREEVQARRAWARADLHTGDQKQVLVHSVNPMFAVAERFDGRLAVGDSDGTCVVLDPRGGTAEYFTRVIGQIPYPGRSAFAFTTGGQHFLCGASGGDIGLRSFSEPIRRLRYREPSDQQHMAVALASDGRSFVAFQFPSNKLSVYELPNGDEEARFQAVRSFSPAGKTVVANLALIDDDRLLLVRDRSGETVVQSVIDGSVHGRRKSPLGTGSSFNEGFAVSADRKQLALVDRDNMIRVVTVPQLMPQFDLERLTTACDALSLSADGRFLAAGERPTAEARESNIHLFDLTTKQRVKTFVGHKETIAALQFLADGKTLVSVGFDLTVRLWDVPQN